jgi:RNA 2',3'-cyclic 3'-phosphodiesterase
MPDTAQYWWNCSGFQAKHDIMHRLFVALRPPVAIRRHLLGLQGGVINARWQRDDQLHLTLRFIGEVDRHCAADVAAALYSVRHPAFEIALKGVGVFDRKGHIDTLWAGVTPHDVLAALHGKVDQAMIRAGLIAESRAYVPHITLARFNRKNTVLNDYLATHAAITSPQFRVDSFGLYESTIGHGGADYTLVERYQLG